jgi:hypothetical protein
MKATAPSRAKFLSAPRVRNPTAWVCALIAVERLVHPNLEVARLHAGGGQTGRDHGRRAGHVLTRSESKVAIIHVFPAKEAVRN